MEWGCLGLEGRRDAVEKEIWGEEETNVTSWFIVLSCHRQACVRPRTPPKSFRVCVRGRIGDGGVAAAAIADAIMAASSAKSLQGLIQIN